MGEDCKKIEECFIRCVTTDYNIWVFWVFWVFCVVLIVSLLLNILCCVLKCCPGKERRQLKKKKKLSSRQMEDNPIYGNLNYTEDNVGLYTEAALLHPSVSSSSLRNPQRVNPDSQPKSQECYANLTLKAPRPQSGRISPQIHSEPAPSQEPAESEKVDDGNADEVSTVSDLYASVQNQRTKTINSTDDGEDYANHL